MTHFFSFLSSDSFFLLLFFLILLLFLLTRCESKGKNVTSARLSVTGRVGGGGGGKGMEKKKTVQYSTKSDSTIRLVVRTWAIKHVCSDQYINEHSLYKSVLINSVCPPPPPSPHPPPPPDCV